MKTRIALFALAVVGMGLAAGARPVAARQNPWEIIKKEAKKVKDQVNATKPKKGETKRPSATPDDDTRPGGQPDAAGRAGAGPPSSAKVESEVLLTAEPGLQYLLSPKGQHMAAVVMRGSREVLIYDGVEGPRFDEVLKSNGRPVVAFSPDGTRYAYVARQGQEYVYMLDGKELVRLPAATTDLTRLFSPQTLDFTPNSRHVYFVVSTKQPRGDNVATLYFDGKPGPPSAEQPSLVSSPDGEHYAYLVLDPVMKRQRTLIVDGKPAPWQGGSPQFTGDSKHLVTTRLLPGSITEVQVDGRPWLRAPEVRLYLAPVTGLIVAAVKPSHQQNTMFLHVGSQKVPGSDAQHIYEVYFSADGRHWAADCQTPAGSHFMIVDGKKGFEYQSVQGIGFTSDGRFVYKAVQPGNKQFIVHGDQESDAYQMIHPVVITGSTAPLEAVIAGNRVGFIANRTFSPDSAVVVIDGKPTPTKAPRDLVFSADGSRYAYGFGDITGARVQALVDGTQHTGVILGPTLPSLERKFAFSPDGKHVVFAASTPDGRARGISLNGKFIPVSQLPAFPIHNMTFTPDGRHLLWVTGFNGTRSAVYVDGLRAAEFNHDGIALTQSTSDMPLEVHWSMGSDGVLTFVAQDGGSLKRFRVTPPDDTSVETLARMSAIR